MSKHVSPHDSVVAGDPLVLHETLADTPLAKYFKAAVKFESSDLIMRGGQAPKLRLRGELKALDTTPPTIEEFNKWIHDGLTEEQIQQYADHGSLDIGCDFNVDGESHRFRVNIFLTRGRSAIAARRVSNEILDFSQLHLPEVMNNIVQVRQGLVLLCGVTGSGKSTTIAAMLDYINQTRACHILTIEDPIEYLFEDKKAMINQREIGLDVPDFPTALRGMVRENPDVVLIGEMRDKETFEAALQASETGHLVFGTIHASSASQAFNRIYDLFEPEERDPIRNILAYQMQAFVYQKLLPTIREELPRVPAVEVLLQSPPTRKLILEGREDELEKVIKDGREEGMRTYVDSLVELVETNYIHPKVAQANAPSPEEIKMRLRGISTG
ncbi:type IV pilus twitching motility protein PilT [Algisphaera agarilytica]|uniref:Twitching motility protein PilT n=1 Tax=Algisphaera agarilytica TaxID=1385975 RepID=A0A7X0H4V4_9BACT|nr:PilT/PilU family type 4a pilus ATPase [Algisphaera agarilytica]MBB6429275.1 twitching motility protein PilT [Algisphaera agarilytica]